MPATLTRITDGDRNHGMPRPKKKPTRQIRVYEDVADLAQQLAGVFKVEVSDLLDDVLRRFLDDKRKEALKLLGSKDKQH